MAKSIHLIIKGSILAAIVVAISTTTMASAVTTANLVPSCSVSAIPGAITGTQSALLKWDSTEGAIFTSIDNGIGAVAVDGELIVSPNISTVYTVHTWNSQGEGGYCSVALTMDGMGLISVSNQSPTVTLQTLAIHPASTRVVLSNMPYTGAAENVLYTLFLLTLILTAGYALKKHGMLAVA